MSIVSNNVLWSSASSITVTSATEVVSDAFTIDDNCINLNLQLSADNQGTPASGDTAIFRVRWSQDNSKYDTAEHSEFLAKLDTVAANTPGEDPAVVSLPVPRAGKYFKIGCLCAQAASRNMVISVKAEEQRYA